MSSQEEEEEVPDKAADKLLPKNKLRDSIVNRLSHVKNKSIMPFKK